MITVKTVCTDMYDGFVKAASEVFGSRVVAIDRYHVSKLYREPLDQLRIEKMKRLKTKLTQQEYARLEEMMWILRRKHECSSKDKKAALEFMYTHLPFLKEAHQMALTLTHIFNTHINRKESLTKMNRWIQKVQNSRLICFDGFIKTLERYKVNILNYFKE